MLESELGPGQDFGEIRSGWVNFNTKTTCTISTNMTLKSDECVLATLAWLHLREDGAGAREAFATLPRRTLAPTRLRLLES